MKEAKESGREYDKYGVRFKTRRLEADWLKDGGQRDYWYRPVMSAMSLIA